MPKKRTRRELRLQFEHQNGLCCWCIKPMTPVSQLANRGTDLMGATWEHLVPQCMGGSHDLSNLVLAHAICNQKRGSKILKQPEFRSYTLAAHS